MCWFYVSWGKENTIVVSVLLYSAWISLGCLRFVSCMTVMLVFWDIFMCNGAVSVIIPITHSWVCPSLFCVTRERIQSLITRNILLLIYFVFHIEMCPSVLSPH